MTGPDKYSKKISKFMFEFELKLSKDYFKLNSSEKL